MKHWTTYPLIAHPYNPEFVSGDGLARFSRAAEAAGFDGIAFTDHPAPSDKWLNAGGHDALDPFAALPYVAAVTDRIRLIPNIVVLPYRNPFHVAPMLDHLRKHTEQAGRDPASIDVAFTTGRPGPGSDGYTAAAHLDGLEAMGALGVTWNSVGTPGDSLDHAVESLEQYGAEVI